MKKILLTIVLLLSSTSLTFAANDVLISSCVNKLTKSMRHINAPQSCKRSEYLLTWNQQGPMGPQGVQGPQGNPGTTANYCTQESLTGNWTKTFYDVENQPSGSTDGFGKKVDAQGNFSASLSGSRYDDASGNDVQVKLNITGTMKILSETPFCTVELQYTTSEQYVNPSDSFVLMQPQTTTFSNFRLSPDGTTLREVSSNFVPAYDKNSGEVDSNGNPIMQHIPDSYSDYVIFLEKASVSNF